MTGPRPVRLFCALPLPVPVKHAIDTWWSQQGDVPSGLRPVPDERLHLTVAFFGSVGLPSVSELQQRLGRAASRHGPFALQLDGGGRFDGHVLWARVVGDVEPLRGLARAAGAAGRRVGLDLEDRRYRPHVTLARASRPMELRPWAARTASLRSDGWTASELELVRSDLAAGGPSYTVLASWPLGRTPDPGGASSSSAQDGRDHDDGHQDAERERDDPATQAGRHQA